MSQRLATEQQKVDTDYILEVLGDVRSRAILDATSRGPKSVERLSEQCGIPSSTVYRRVKKMTDEGVLNKDVRYRDDGQHVEEYRMAETLSGQQMQVSPSLKLEVSYEGPDEDVQPELSRVD